MTTLHRLLYRSQCAIDGAPTVVDAEIHRIVEAAREANRRSGVTGALLWSSGVFLQVLEGPLDAIEAIFESICGDLRHRDVQLIDFATCEERSFPEWPMVAINASGALFSLCTAVEAIEPTRINAASASAAIQMMRVMVLTEGEKARAA